MSDYQVIHNIEQACVIVEHGMGSKIIRFARKQGFTGATVIQGVGTVNSRFWDFIGLSDTRKEIVIMVAEEETCDHGLEAMAKEFSFHKHNHGIAFTTKVAKALGTILPNEKNLAEDSREIAAEDTVPGQESNLVSKNIEQAKNEPVKGCEEMQYYLITTIVDRGKGEEVMEAANAAGSKGGTIMNGRGSGIHETGRLFGMEIEPEKEIVLILSEAHATDAIVASIIEKMKLEEPGNGIIFVQDTGKTYGIYQ